MIYCKEFLNSELSIATCYTNDFPGFVYSPTINKKLEIAALGENRHNHNNQ